MQHLQNLGQAQPAYRALAAARLIEGVCAPWQGRGLVGGPDPALLVFSGSSRCGFALVTGLHFFGGGVVMHHKRTTANARRLRLHQTPHHLRRFRGIGQKAPAFTRSQPALLASGLAMTTPPRSWTAPV